MIPADKKEEIKELLKQVNVADICRQHGLRPASVSESLGDRRRDHTALKVVVREARKIVAQQAAEIDNL
ncbi:hypothetical protein [Chitinophaga rhizosphaerae]|uniref:hypothetical protein n=1 Tax=Chitinophaga rhizosphaerae TaxID=1864947 RepID=UPI000F806731|nr:hypothetical protein [Chitinophaga rhizosphaerae]